MKHGSIKPRQHCNYGGVQLNTAGSKILAENFILALSRQTWLGVIQDIDVLIENVSVTESNSELAKNLFEDTLESKSDNHDNDENIPFPFLKKIKSQHPKDLFFGQLNVKTNSPSHYFTTLSKWFYNSFMVLNPDKCSFML